MQIKCPSCGCTYAADQAGGLCPRCLAAMAVKMSDTPVDEVPIEPGEMFHGLMVQKLVARGGMGIIYRARQPVSNRDVALKILPRSLAAEEEFRLRFDREARALAGLNHPNIVNLYDYGLEGDLMFLVMEFVEGVSLRHHLREKRIDPERALQIAIDLCDALQFAHREGIVHRDLKPENVLIDRSGRVKLTDFGLAKRVDNDSTQLTQTNFAVGTPHYMAPEQLEQPKSIDHRVDIYSMGVLLYEMLTRELPIGRFPPPSSKHGVDERLDDIVYRCLDKDPDRRYPTVAQLKSAIQSATGKSYEAPISGLPEDRPTPVRPKVANNLSVTCPCGWEFFVPAAARGMVHCPSCGDPLMLSAPTPAGPRPATTRRAISPSSRIPAPKKLLIAAGLLTGLVALFLFLVLGPASSERDPEPQEISSGTSRPYTGPPLETLPAVTPKDKPQPVKVDKPVEIPKPATPPGELRRRLHGLVAQSNMAGLVATILLNSGRPRDHEQLQARAAQLDGEIKDLILQIEEQGFRQEAPDRFRPGDRISSFAGKKSEFGKTMAFADELRAWLRAFRPGNPESLTVLRNRQYVTFKVEFPERATELVELVHQVGIVLGETPGYVPAKTEAAPPPTAPFPVALMNEVKQRLAALPPFYRNSLPYDDRGRGEALLLAGQGTSEDTVFLSGRFIELIRRCESEQHGLVARVKELEAKIAEPAAVTDTVVCKDGRRLEGTIIEDTGEILKIRVRLGTITLQRDEVLRVEKGKGSASEFRTAYETARGQKTELIKLLTMAKDRKLPVHAELAAVAILVVDPGDERSRIDAGLPRNPFAIGAEPEPVAPGDRIEYNNKLYTPEQLRAEFRALGYVQVNGLWCEKIQGSFRVNNLYGDQVKLPATFAGTSVQAQTKSEQGTYWDFKSKAWLPITKQISLARYVGGSGTCTIEINVPGELVDCRVHARSQVSRLGGFVSVSVGLGPNEAGKVLYTLAAPGENDSSYDVTEKVFGARTFYVRADIRDGMFLISDSNDLSVFEVKYSYGKPLERLNALFVPKVGGGDGAVDVKPVDAVETACRNFAAGLIQIVSIADALSEMRKATEGLSSSREFVMPSKFSDVATQLKDPLVPDWNGMTRDQALKMGSWWGLQGVDDRREFLTAYGLWCARTRYLRGR